MFSRGFRAIAALLPAVAAAATPTYNREVAPILFRYCSECHRPGEAGPFSLLTYADAKAHAHQIAAVTHSRFMPPWLPEAGPFPIRGERRLTEEQIETIRRWVASGAPEGNPADAPAPPHFEPGWQLGKPDLIVQASKPFRLPASGTDVYWNFILPVPLAKTRWVRAIEIRPGDKRLVHHANILIDRLQTAREMEKEPGVGFGGMEIRVESEAFDPDSHLLFWKPGTTPSELPSGMSLRLDKGTDLLLNMHLQPSGKPEWIQPSVGIYFTDQPATLHPMLLELENDAALKIPAGAEHFEVTDKFTLPAAVDLLAIYPHAHYLGKVLRATATLPTGVTQPLLTIPNWDLNWQGVYTYEHSIALPAGTTVAMHYEYDNSSGNPRNPNHPPIEVHGGNRANDEMAHLWLQVLPHAETNGRDPRLVLQEALSQHEVEKDPTVFEAQYNLAAMLMDRGEPGPAIQHYQAASRIRPNDPVVFNALGSAELAKGDLQAAVKDLRQAATLRPGYFDAHYNLGLALASSSDFKTAADELKRSTELKPDDAGAHANFGAALAQLGHYRDAQSELEAALRLNPNDADAKQNLAALKQMAGSK